MAETEDKKEGEKKLRLGSEDWKKVEGFIKSTLDERKRSDFRRYHEEIWKEVDRQVVMKPLVKVNRDGSKDDQGWHNVFELGELARASELITSDVLRILFPNYRSAWFEAHCELPLKLNVQTGKPEQDEKTQSLVDGSLRSLMTQQHEDFGFRSRIELSLKEALHHGSFVAEVRTETMQMVFDGTKVKNVTAPVWVPHSMWNSYPDISPSIIGTNMFYNGSMIIEEFIPRHKLKAAMVGDGWITSQFNKVPKDEHKDKDNKTKDVKLTKWWGDIVIDRSRDMIEYPNHFVILANGVCVYLAPMELPYSPIIFRGYEKMDVRDTYYISPIIKFSPMHKMATILANRFVDAIELDIEPPLVYDGNDSDLVMNDGPVLAPGSKVAAKTSYDMKYLESGDPNAALEGLKLSLNYLQENLGRPGADISQRPVVAEVEKKQQDTEAGLIGFIDKVESSVRSYLYMQHEFNKREMTDYSLYNPESDAPDFMRLSKDKLPKNVHFEVVGARSVLGEMKRSQGMTQITVWAAKIPMFSMLLKPDRLLKQAYQDAGVKHPEEFIKGPNELPLPPQVMMQLQLMQKQLMMLKQAYTQEKSKNDVNREKNQLHHKEKLLSIAADLEKTIMQLEHAGKQHADNMAKDLMQMAISDQTPPVQ